MTGFWSWLKWALTPAVLPANTDWMVAYKADLMHDLLG